MLTVISYILFVGSAHAAIIYIDNSMGANCVGGNYSLVNRNCTGSDGNAYTNIAAAHAFGSGGANNIFYLRAGTYTSNIAGTAGIGATANGQTWATYPGDLPTRAHITSATHEYIFDIQTWDNFTLKDLRISGATGQAIKMENSSNSLVQDIELFNFSSNSLYKTDGSGGYNHGTAFGAHSGLRQDNLVVRRVHVHSPNNPGANQGCLVGGSDNTSNWVFEDNVVEDCPYGIWFDVDGGNAADGNTPFLVQRNIARDISKACYHIEARSSATFINNVGIRCSEGFRMRPGPDLMQSVKFQNNTLYNFSMIGIWVQGDQPGASTANINIDNNILYSSVNTSFALSVGLPHLAVATNTYRNNVFHVVNNAFGICWSDNLGTSPLCEGTNYADSSAGISSWQSACPTCTGNVAGDPLFTAAGSEDFRLQAGSIARNTAIPLAGVTTDFNNVVRPQGAGPDIGSFEFVEDGGGGGGGGGTTNSGATSLTGKIVTE
jgi:hypothetical protein